MKIIKLIPLILVGLSAAVLIPINAQTPLHSTLITNGDYEACEEYIPRIQHYVNATFTDIQREDICEELVNDGEVQIQRFNERDIHLFFIQG